ncbi:MAG: HNH endonuclease signature motif containing protein, partial [Bdellovibrionota bacterium]
TAGLFEMILKDYIRRKDPLAKKPRAKTEITSAAEAAACRPAKSPSEKPQITSAAEVKSETPPNKLQKPALCSRVRRHDAVEQGHLMDGKPTNSPKSAERSRNQRTHIEAELKRSVLKRDQEGCTHKDPRTGRRCGSKSWIEIDHIIPVAIGGQNEIENLRVLCRAHNGYAAVRKFGAKKMDVFFKR